MVLLSLYRIALCYLVLSVLNNVIAYRYIATMINPGDVAWTGAEQGQVPGESLMYQHEVSAEGMPLGAQQDGGACEYVMQS